MTWIGKTDLSYSSCNAIYIDLLHQEPSDENADLASANAAAVCHTAWMQSLQLNLQHGVLPTHAVHGEYTGNQLI